MAYLFTSESVSEGHPDKVADQISDAIVDAMLAQDPQSRIACETLVTTGLVVLAGEVKTKAMVDFQKLVRETIKKIGYTKAEYMFEADSCAIINTLHEQSADISRGVDKGAGKEQEQGAGDQGMMFGYATNETDEKMPMALAFSHRILKKLAQIRKEGKVMTYLRPDSKAQVTIEYDDDNNARKVHTIVISTQHDEFDSVEQMQEQIEKDIKKYVLPEVIPSSFLTEDTVYHINPTGNFVIGGPHGDAGLTGRKIIVDTYGGRGAHGGGAFSGKDPSKVDRSAAYACRHIAKNLVAAGVSDEVLVQVAYAIGVPEPISLNVQTFGTSRVGLTDGEIAEKVKGIFDMSPKGLIDRLNLTKPVYQETAAYGHMGREPFEKDVVLTEVIKEESRGILKETRREFEENIQFFSWEKLDYVDKIKEAFKL